MLRSNAFALRLKAPATKSSEGASAVSELVQPAFSTKDIVTTPLSLSARMACLAALLSLELIIISIWLDTASLARGKHLVALVHDWGAWGVRVAVAFMVFGLVFANSAKKGELQPPVELPKRLAAWDRLVLHFFAMASFIALSGLLFNMRPSGSLADLVVVSWLAAGLFAGGAAAVAFVPSTIWRSIAKSNGAAFAYAFTAGTLAYLLGVFAWQLWQPLSQVTFGLVRIILRPFMPALISEPSTLSIGSRAFMVTIAPECSGYEGIGLVIAFAAAWLWILRAEWRFPQALLLLPAGAIAIWVFNALRIAFLILVGNAGAVRIALGGFHSQAGWIAFTIVTVGICLGARHVSWLNKAQPALATEGVSQNLATPYLAPFLAVLGTALISRAASADFEWLYPMQVLVALLALWCFRRGYQKLDWRAGWPALALGALVSCLWISLDYLTAGHLTHDAPSALGQSSPAARFAWLAFRVVGAVAAAPVTEELAYRGFLMRRLISRRFESVSWQHFSWTAIVISSLAYGALQGRQFVAGTIAGFVFAIALLRKGRIGDAVAAHASANAIIAVWVIVGRNWQIW